MSALAGVTTDGVGQPVYPQERLQKRPAEEAPTVLTADRVVAEGPEIVRFAERADEGVRAGGEGVFHLLSDLLDLTPLIMAQRFTYDIAQMDDFFSHSNE
jgi:hypothetical protein